jgi:hypothetical protein
MAIRRNSCLNDAAVRDELKRAWEESNPSLASGHEEGGFVLREIDGLYTVRRWRRGAKDSIDVPPHLGCKYDDVDIAASFHTHPNTGNDYLQEPSETDKRAVRDDEDLKGEYYEGEYVISSELIYLVTPSGSVREIGETAQIFGGEV